MEEILPHVRASDGQGGNVVFERIHVFSTARGCFPTQLKVVFWDKNDGPGLWDYSVGAILKEVVDNEDFPQYISLDQVRRALILPRVFMTRSDQELASSGTDS